ncbi:MAG: response regulator [Suipraeoptans sp.]
MNIIIVDDDALVSQSLKMILEADDSIDVLAIGNDGKDAISLYEKHQPDVLLMDIQMKEVSGLEAAETIINKYSQAKILLLTTFSDDEYIVKAIKVGVKGYILKQDYANILPSLQTVFAGQSVFGTEVVSKIPALMKQNRSVDFSSYGINEKECEVMRLVSDGYSNKEISEELYLSEGTIRNYLSTILDKLDLRDRTQLAIFYLKAEGNE